jgi:hypothetical protein
LWVRPPAGPSNHTHMHLFTAGATCGSRGWRLRGRPALLRLEELLKFSTHRAAMLLALTLGGEQQV